MNKPSKRSPFLRVVVKRRKIIQIVIAIAVYAGIGILNINLLWVVLGGSALGIVFGKVFCRWACPIGLFMELMMGMSADTKFRQMYQYHKLGCPIAWISGYLNRLSLFRVKRDAEACTSCGACDKVCYISTLEPGTYSLFKKGRQSPATSFSCSKCLECVAVCPTKSLSYSALSGIKKR
jgi:4Fe-4S binding domain.